MRPAASLPPTKVGLLHSMSKLTQRAMEGIGVGSLVKKWYWLGSALHYLEN